MTGGAGARVGGARPSGAGGDSRNNGENQNLVEIAVY